MNTHRYIGTALVTADIHLMTGLHIGAGKDNIEIAGIDNAVVKHPISGDPYIPGSSVKGKLRFVSEWGFGRLRRDGLPWGARDDPALNLNDPVARIFGTATQKWEGGPTRLLVRDAALDDGWRREQVANGAPMTEIKTEVLIDRRSGKSYGNIGPRDMERVPAGAKFNLEMAFRLYDTGDGGKCDCDCLNWTIAALGLLQKDALGGSGSRGYGKVKFESITVALPTGVFEQDELRDLEIPDFDRNRAPDVIKLRANPTTAAATESPAPESR
jgi:CRISPR-associated protein Csm3